MDISINKVGQNGVVIVTQENGETPQAFTVAQIRDWVLELLAPEDTTNGSANRATIIDKVLERFELDLINPV